MERSTYLHSTTQLTHDTAEECCSWTSAPLQFSAFPYMEAGDYDDTKIQVILGFAIRFSLVCAGVTIL
jgi:hypothetical protein